MTRHSLSLRDTPRVPTPSVFLMLHRLLNNGRPNLLERSDKIRIKLLYCSLQRMSGRNFDAMSEALSYMLGSQSPVAALCCNCLLHSALNLRVVISKSSGFA
jgi:hypothetical protein